MNKLLLRINFTALLYKLFFSIGYSSNMQRRTLKKFLQYVQEHNSYFGTLLQGKNITTKNANYILHELPLLSKEIIREKGRFIYNDNINEKWSIWRNTGGSTGEPLHFPVYYMKSFFFDKELIHQAYLYKKMGCSISDTIVSIDGSRISEEDVRNNKFWNVKKKYFPYGNIHYSTLYLNEENFEYYYNSINSEKPNILRGYPSGVKTFCQFLKERSLKLSFKLKAVYLTSENFDEEMASHISSILDCDVWGQYGHTEMSIFAYKKPHESCYYCSPLYGVTEILDENGNQVKKGECGEIVVTGFTNVGLPFIRYKTGDFAVYGGTKRNGTIIINNLLGRSKDYIYDKQGKKIYLVGFVFGGHIKAFNDIKEWQIRQSEKGKLTILIVKGTNYTQSTEDELKGFFDKKEYDIELIYTDKIEKTTRGKQKFLIQEIKENE
ncbi:MAG: phenylacetate--CoA ligase family protein [Prevotella sp.]|nr:phenylacetate--CoA ligase family protein [Prevotella sp.]